MHRTTAVLLIAFLLPTTASATPAAAESPAAAEARETFRSLFGRDVARARGTPASEDDVALAKRLLAVARNATASPAFLAILCDEAYALAAPHERGEATAAGAMHLLAEHVPDRAEEARERLASLRGEPETPSGQEGEPSGEEAKPAAESKEAAEPAEPAAQPMGPKAELDALLAQIEEKKEAGALVEAAGLYRKAKALAKASGDDRLGAIEAGAEILARRIGLERRARDVRAMLERDPDNVSAREGLVRLYLVNLNDPKRAAEVLKGVEDADLKKYVPAAAKPVDEAPELACLELGEWYKGLAERAPDYAKATMFGRAKTYLDRFLSLHETKDMAQVRAKVAMEKVEEALASLGPAAGQATSSKEPAGTVGGIADGVIKPGQWVDLLPLVDPEKDAVEGIWKRERDCLVLQNRAPSNRCMLPLATSSSYTLELAFERTDGDSSFSVVLPLGSGRATLEVAAWDGSTGGLQYIAGESIRGSRNPTKFRAPPLENGSMHRLHIGVRVHGGDVAVMVTLDGRQVVDWKGAVSELDVPDFWRLPEAGVFGVGAWKSCYTVHRMRLKMLSGEARLLRPSAAETGGEGGASQASVGGEPSPDPTRPGATKPASEKPAGTAGAPEGGVIQPGGWVDLLPLVDPDKDGVEGIWKRDGEGLVLQNKGPHNRCMFPLATSGSYALELAFERTAGEQTFKVYLPGGSRHVMLVVAGYGGSLAGLEYINDRRVDERPNPTTFRTAALENGKVYGLRIGVRVHGDGVAVTATLDGRQVVDWKGSVSALSISGGWSLPKAGTFGVGAWKSCYTVHRMRLKMLSGEARLLRPATTKPATVPEGKTPDFFDLPSE